MDRFPAFLAESVRYKRRYIFIFAVSVALILPPAIFGILAGFYPISLLNVPHASLGPVGDYFGGLLNPLISYLGLSGLVASLWFTASASNNSAEALRAETAARQVARAQDLLDEFYSSEFIKHRIVVSTIRQKVLAGKVDIDFLTRGYLNLRDEEEDGNPTTYYEGAVFGELNEHQHLSIYLGYLIRLAGAVEFNVADSEMIKRLLDSQYQWHSRLLNIMLASADKNLKSEVGRVHVPGWMHAVTVLNALFEPHEYNFRSPVAAG